MDANHVARSQITVHAPPSKVWDALTKPELVKQYLMGADVHTDWKVGSPLEYTGTYQGKPDQKAYDTAPWNGNKRDWELALANRNQSQNEYKRIR